jgi:hypothetical protein
MPTLCKQIKYQMMGKVLRYYATEGGEDLGGRNNHGKKNTETR